MKTEVASELKKEAIKSLKVNLTPPPKESWPQVVDRFWGAGQGHLFDHVSTLEPEQLAAFYRSLANISLEVADVLALQAHQSPSPASHHLSSPPSAHAPLMESQSPNSNRNQELTATPKAASLTKSPFLPSQPKTAPQISPLPTELIEAWDPSNPLAVARRVQWEARGLADIAAGRVALLSLSGGQGSRLGAFSSKGLKIFPPFSETLFQLQAQRIRRIRDLAAAQHLKSPQRNVSLPWYIMCHPSEFHHITSYLNQNHYFGLLPKDVTIFVQKIVPCFDLNGKLLLDSLVSVATSPNGNGGVFSAANDSGLLDDMRKRGIASIFVYNVDNILAKLADPIFVGFFSDSSASVALKTAKKSSSNEAVGVLVYKNGRPAIVHCKV